MYHIFYIIVFYLYIYILYKMYYLLLTQYNGKQRLTSWFCEE